MMKIKWKNICLKDDLQQNIEDQASREYPMECCGILFGRSSDEGGMTVISEYVPLHNGCENEDRNRHFVIDSMELYECESKYRQNGLEIVGFVHSHPDVPAVLSKADESGMIPGLLYMIPELCKGKCTDIRVWIKDSLDTKAAEIPKII